MTSLKRTRLNFVSYGARLPDVSALLCQKFGGPKNPSPKRPPPTDLKAASQENMKPGAPIPRSGSRKHRRTLERVLTDDRSRHKRQLPTLARSATEPILQVKREVRDTSLSSIPLNKVPISKRYTQREIDLQAASQNTKSKHKKMKLDQELQGAIAAIKRPDPKMAGREFVETVEKRQGGSYLQSRINLPSWWARLLTLQQNVKIRFLTRLLTICKSWQLQAGRNVTCRLSCRLYHKHNLPRPVRPMAFLHQIFHV